MAAIFGLAVTLWIFETLPLWVTGLIVILLQILFIRIPHGPVAYVGLINNPAMIMILCGMCLGAAIQLNSAGDRLIGRYLQTWHSHPLRLLVGLMLISAFLAMWMTNTAAAAVILPLALPLLTKIDHFPNYRISLLLAIGLGANIGSILTPIGTAPNLIAISLLKKTGISISFGEWIGLTLPFGLLLLTACTLILAHINRKSDVALPVPSQAIPNWTIKGICTIGVLATTGILWICSPLLHISEPTIALWVIGFLLVSGLLPVRKLHTLDWELLVLVWSGICLGVGIEQSGLAKTLIQHPLFQGSPYALAVGMMIIAFILSSVISNTATALMLMPIALKSVPAAHSTIVVYIALACSCGMVLPISTPANMLIFSRGWMKTKDLLFAGGLVSTIGLLTLILAYFVF